MKKMIPTHYPNLIGQISGLLEKARNAVVKQINTTMVQTYRHIGKYIIEYEQGGSDRAEYGTKLIEKISHDLTEKFGKGFSYRNLQQIKKLYLTFPNLQTLSAQFTKILSWSHYVFLMSIRNADEKNFYLIESQHNQRSLRELKRQFNSGLYERLALSKDKENIMQLATQGQIVTSSTQALKDPYILEFLGLDEKSEYSESELEQAIITNLEYFLLELGKGFTFVGRQKRFTAGEKHFFVDLVFYHRFLKCFVLIDLKIGEITHQDIGQMQMYVNRYDAEYKAPDENKTIGLLLCKVKNDIVLQYTLPSNDQIFAKEYQLYLPNKEQLQAYLQKHLVGSGHNLGSVE